MTGIRRAEEPAQRLVALGIPHAGTGVDEGCKVLGDDGLGPNLVVVAEKPQVGLGPMDAIARFGHAGRLALAVLRPFRLGSVVAAVGRAILDHGYIVAACSLPGRVEGEGNTG